MRHLLVFVFLLGLSGCELLVISEPESTAVIDTDAAWAAHNEKLNTLEAWSIDGRISLRFEEEAWHATLLWQQIDQAYRIRLFGPFGAGAIELNGSPQAVVLTQDGQQQHSQDPEQLLAQQLGYRVPINGLRYWAVGQKMPEKPAKIKLDALGRLENLEQDGWTIRYRSYVTVEGYSLPSKIFMDNKGLDVRIVIDRWQITGPDA